MAEAILDLRLDTVQPNRVRLVYGVQNDYNSRYICARFTANGKPIDIEKTAAVRINAKRPDGNKDAFPGTVNTDGTAKVPVAQWMLDVPGEVSASITAVTTNGALTTQEFYIMAKASLWDSTGEPSAENPDKDVLQTIIASENERVAAESTRVANENARKSAETARATAETKRITDEATRVANEAERVSAESVRKAEFATWSEEVGKISAFDKRLENLEAAVSPEIVTPTVDSTLAYRKTVPANVLPNAAVCEIGGMSYKCENLAVPNISHQWGNTAKIDTDGKVTLTVTDSNEAIFSVLFRANVKAGEKYYIKLHNAVNVAHAAICSDAYGMNQLAHATREDTFTTDIDRTIYIGLYAPNKAYVGTVASCYVMFNKGETALPYQPYFTGLRDSKVTEIESDSVNMCNLARIPDTLNGLTFVKNADGSVTINGTCNAYTTIYFDKINIKAGEKFYFLGGQNGTIFTFNGNMGDTFIKNIVVADDTIVQAVECDGTYDNFHPILLITAGTVLSNVTVRFMASKTPFTSFSPYFRNTFPIPEPVQNLDGYGQGINANCYNKIVLNPAEGVEKFVKASSRKIITEVFDDSGTTYDNIKYYAIPKLSDAIDYGKYTTNIIIADYEITLGNWASADNIGKISGVANTSRYWVGFPVDTTLEQAKSALIGLPFEYALATPTETDVSHLFADDNLLPVEAGGTITAVNEYEQAVPFTIEYTVKGA